MQQTLARIHVMLYRVRVLPGRSLKGACRVEERTISSKTVYQGRILAVEALDVELEDGRRSKRDVIRHRGAAAVLTRLPDKRFVLVRQFRKPVEREVLEIVAGGLEKGEAPEACAVREVEEETGHGVSSLAKLGVIWPTPGYCSEELHLFFAELVQEPGKRNLDRDENVETVCIGEKDLEGMIERNEIRDAKTIAAWTLWKARKE